MKKKTAEYLMRAEHISSRYLRDGSEVGRSSNLVGLTHTAVEKPK